MIHIKREDQMDILGIAKRVVAAIEKANVGFDFVCDADREEAVDIVADELRAAAGAEANRGAE
jgi:hypothetical protein